MKGSVIANLTLEGAEEMVNGFNEDELEQWRVGVWNGIKSNDWLDLLERRTYISDYQTRQTVVDIICTHMY